MRVLLYTHPACELHRAGQFHPERPARIDAVVRGVRSSGMVVDEREAPRATSEDLAAVHDPEYVEAIEEFCAAGGGALDPDTGAVPESWEAALRAAGSGLAAVEAMRAGEGDVAVLAVRPPGHHALTARAMGFCLFNNVAVAAERVAAAGERAAIVDWDVHHGNGTQDTFYSRGDVLYVSTHGHPLYPGTGWLEEDGGGEGEGTVVNIPLPPGTAGDAARSAYERIVIPVVAGFEPDWLLVSAGYDAHRDDPLADLSFGAEDYAAMAGKLAEVVPSGRTLVFLEGGYHLDAIESSVAATMRGFDHRPPGEGTTGSGRAAFEMIDAAARVASKHWSGVQDG